MYGIKKVVEKCFEIFKNICSMFGIWNEGIDFEVVMKKFVSIIIIVLWLWDIGICFKVVGYVV